MEEEKVREILVAHQRRARNTIYSLIIWTLIIFIVILSGAKTGITFLAGFLIGAILRDRVFF
jgi:hypothetical protein